MSKMVDCANCEFQLWDCNPRFPKELIRRGECRDRMLKVYPEMNGVFGENQQLKSETYQQMCIRHKHELKQLQDNCTHPKEFHSQWYEVNIVNHNGDYAAKKCNLCGKEVVKKFVGIYANCEFCEAQSIPKPTEITCMNCEKPISHLQDLPQNKR